LRRLLRMLLLLLLACLLLAGGGWFAVRQALRHEPKFYRQALTQSPADQRVAGVELEREVLDLHNQVRHEGRWQARFTEQQLNGWLAVDLPNKFPKLLPKQASDPRMALRDGEALFACRHQSKEIDGVVSIAMRVSLTEQTNELAIRVSRVRMGALPVPLSKFLDQISSAARREGLRLRWAEQSGDPVALIRLAPRHPEFPDRQIEVDQVQIEGGALTLSGVVAPQSTMAEAGGTRRVAGRLHFGIPVLSGAVSGAVLR